MIASEFWGLSPLIYFLAGEFPSGEAYQSFHGVATCVLRAYPCKNRPLKLSWKMDCLHFFYTGQATYAMNEIAFIPIESLF